MTLPELPLILGVIFWSIVGLGITSAAWPSSKPEYREWLAATIGIEVEAIGVGLATGSSMSILGPLAVVLVLALVIRFGLPRNEADLAIALSFRGRAVVDFRGATAIRALFVAFFLIGAMTLLFSLEGLWDAILRFPGS